MIINPYFVTAGGGGATPSDIANIWDWWEPSRDTYNNNDPMPTLTGQFAAHNFTSTGSNRPIYTTNVLNSLAVSTHTASSLQGWSGVNTLALTAGHGFIVVKINNDPPATDNLGGLWAFGADFIPTLYPNSSGTIVDSFGNHDFGNTVGNPGPTLAAWRVYEVISTSSEWTALLDGSQLFTNASNTVQFKTNSLLGTNSGAQGLDGQLAGMYLFSAKITGASRTSMVNYLNTRFGLAIT